MQSLRSASMTLSSRVLMQSGSVSPEWLGLILLAVYVRNPESHFGHIMLTMSSLVLAMPPNTSRPYSLPTRTKCVYPHAARLHVAQSTCDLRQVDLALAVAVGSCIQISLFVIPVLVLIGWAIGKPMSLLCAFSSLPSRCFN